MLSWLSSGSGYGFKRIPRIDRRNPQTLNDPHDRPESGVPVIARSPILPKPPPAVGTPPNQRNVYNIPS